MAGRNGETIPIAPVAAKVRLQDLPPSDRYLLIALNRLEKQFGPVVRKIRDVSKPVDEYSTESVVIDNVTTVTVFPEYTHMAERIESVIVTGPASTAFTLTLGDRSWDVLTNVSGLFQILGAGLLMSFNDTRSLVSATAGNWTLELTGFADERYFAA
jgi:hypothetical protein